MSAMTICRSKFTERERGNMDYLSTRDLYRLLSFEFDIPQITMRKACDVSTFIWDKDVDVSEMMPKIDVGLAKLFGSNYRSKENIKRYERHKGIANDVDPKKLVQLRLRKKYSISKLAKETEVSYSIIKNLENSEVKIQNWRVYKNLSLILEDDLLKADSKYKERKDKNRKPKKRSITFKNIATRDNKLSWEMGHKVVY